MHDRNGDDPGGVWHPRRRRLTAGLVLIVSLTAFEALAVATALPAAVDDIGGLRFYGWAFSSFMLANLVGIPTAGDAADRVGVHRPFVLGCTLFTIGLIAAGLSPGFPVFIAGRVLQGFGAGAISSAAYVAIARAYASEDRPRMLAVLSSAWVIPGMIGPAAAGVLTQLFGWRSVFLFLIPLVVAAMLMAMPPLRRLGAPQGAADTPSRRGAAWRLALGTGIALAAAEMPNSILAPLVLVAGLAIALPGFRQLMPAGVLRARPGLPAAVATLGVISAAFFGAEAYVPLAITKVRGQSALFAGGALTAATIFWAGGTWVQERLAGRSSHRALACSGLALMFAGIAGVGALLSDAVPVSSGPLCWGVAGLGIGIAFPTSMLVALECAAAGREGEASSSMQLASVLGAALGTGIGGSLLALATSSGHSPALGIAWVDAFALLLALPGFAAAAGLPHSRAA